MAEGLDLDAIRRRATPAEWAEVEKLLALKAAGQLFFPTPRQSLVASSEADIVGYGGAAGGGKSYLVAGLAVSQHRRTSITRPQKNQTRKFVQEIGKILGSTTGLSRDTWSFTTPDGVERFVSFFGLDNPGDEEKQQGDDYDLKAYDEVTQMREADIRYTLTWNRSDAPDQRVRALLTFNPPTTPEGRWVIRFFGPWLDDHYPGKRAVDGELRWFTTIGDNQDFEVAGPQPFIIKRMEDGSLKPWYSFDAKDYAPEDIIKPKSRTFIRAMVTDNPYYMATGYMQQLQLLPEPLRSQMLKGDFKAGVTDDSNQVIPTAWIYAAQERWRQMQPRFAKGVMDSLGCDAARGGNMGSTQGATGNDELVISPRYGTYFDTQIVHKGIAIDTGDKAASLIVAELRDQAPTHLDVAGVGTSVYDFLAVNNIHVVPVNASAASVGMDKSGLLKFFNKRAEYHWRMREAFDPMNPEPIAIPPDEQLAVDLAAPRWFLSKSGIQIEDKEAIKKRIGRSPDRGEALMLANITTPKRLMQVSGYANLPSNVGGMSYEERRLRELDH